MAVACVDRSPVPCLEDGCPASELSCAWLAKNDGCPLRFSDLWSSLPAGYEPLSSLVVQTECPASCGTCTESGLRAAVSGATLPWPKTGVLRLPDQLPGDASSALLAAAIEAATVRGPLIITDAYGAAFRPEAWSRAALQARCAPPPGVTPSPPWPTIAWADPSLTGNQWAAMRFGNGAALGVRGLGELMAAQDDGRLRGVALFDSMANHTCPRALLLRRGGEVGEGGGGGEGSGGGGRQLEEEGLPAPRFFPRDFEASLGGARGEGLWRKGGAPFGDPDLFVSKARLATPWPGNPLAWPHTRHAHGMHTACTRHARARTR
jgi:hypothetical protein